MISWLVQHARDYPGIAGGEAVRGVLHPAEEQRLELLTFAKRRREWQLGRITAKLLMQSYLEVETGYRFELDRLVIGREPSGMPVALLEASQAERLGWDEHVSLVPLVGDAGVQPEGVLAVPGVRLPVSLSISHSNGAALCALCATNGQPRWIGIDIERIEARSERFVLDFLSDAEQAWLAGFTGKQRDILVTATWSAKESVLKALRLGLTVDTRRVTALCQWPFQDQIPWSDVQVSCDPALLPRPNGHFGVSPTDALAQSWLTGWWRAEDDYVLTMTLLQADPIVEKEHSLG